MQFTEVTIREKEFGISFLGIFFVTSDPIGGGARETYSESLPSIGSSARLIEEYSRGVGVEEER